MQTHLLQDRVSVRRAQRPAVRRTRRPYRYVHAHAVHLRSRDSHKQEHLNKSNLCVCVCTGVGTKIDPTLCRADRMVGQVLGAVGALPEIFTELEISYFLLRRLLGVRTEGDKKAAKVRHRGMMGNVVPTLLE